MEDIDLYRRIVKFIHEKQKKYNFEKALQLSYCYKNYILYGCTYHVNIMKEIITD